MKTQKLPTLLPLASMLLFVLCYWFAASYYPGGFPANPHYAGFSVKFNYLCDLLDTETINGSVNAGRIWAQLGLCLLCLGLIFLFLKLPILLRSSLWKIKTMTLSAILALGSTGLLLFADHDSTVRIAGVFGVVALFLAVQGLSKARRFGLARFGIWCLSILLLNYFMYESGAFLSTLPVLQKVTFISFLSWFTAINISIYRLEICIEANQLLVSDKVKGSKPVVKRV